MKPLKAKIWHFFDSLSLGARILLVFLLTAILAVSILVVSFRFFALQSQQRVLPVLAFDYVARLMQELGDPVNLQQAEKIYQRTGLNIFIQKPGKLETIGDPGLKKLLELNGFYHVEKYHNFFFKFYRGQAIIKVVKPGETLYFIVPWRGPGSHSFWIVYVFPVAIVLLVFAAYQVVRYLIKPVQDIEQGVAHFAKGKLSYRIPVRRGDDLGKLTEKINEMASRIEQMLAAKRQLLLAISHELRTPMTRINIALNLPDSTQNREKMKHSIAEMEKLLAELLEGERISDEHKILDLTEADLNELILSVIDDFFPAENSIHYAPSAKASVQCDVNRIRLAIKNIIDNALKYGKANPVDISLLDEADYYIIRIIDRGAGISEQAKPHVFEPFFREDQSRQRKTGGTGLGLYLVKTIIEAHKGAVELSSYPDIGTIVTLSLKKAVVPSNP